MTRLSLDLASANKPVKIARKYDIPRHTVYAWLTRFKKNRLKVFQYQIPIVLTNEEQKFLQDLILNTASKPTIILRARILLALAQGISSNLICSKYGTSWRTINKWGNRFRKERLKGLQDDKRCKPLATFYPTVQ